MIAVFASLVLVPFLNEPGVPGRLTRLCREALEQCVRNGRPPAVASPADYPGSVPVFVTLKKDGTTRGCAGTFQPRFGSLAEELVFLTAAAATQDIRYPPVRFEELAAVRVVVSFPGRLSAISSLDAYNPWKQGLLVRKGGREGVVLPCEAKTTRYAVKKCLRQAGIADMEGCSFYAFECRAISEGIP